MPDSSAYPWSRIIVVSAHMPTILYKLSLYGAVRGDLVNDITAQRGSEVYYLSEP